MRQCTVNRQVRAEPNHRFRAQSALSMPSCSNIPFGDIMALVSVRLAACGHAKLRSEHATPAPLPAACWQHFLREHQGIAVKMIAFCMVWVLCCRDWKFSSAASVSAELRCPSGETVGASMRQWCCYGESAASRCQ